MSSSSNPARTFDAPMSLAEFRQPPSRFGLAPFWFWNGDMDEERIRQQVHAMKKAHVGGFFIHPRQGMTLPYLSHEFFSRVRTVVQEAAELGMEAWLYDEFPYPSGIAGGVLTANYPELRARVLQHHTRNISEGEAVRWELPLGRAVCALAVPRRDGKLDWEDALDVREHLGVVLTRDELWLWPMGHIPYNEKRYMADEGALVLEWTAPPSSGKWQLVVGLDCEQRGHKYFDVWFDPLHPDAAPRFLELTHERYAQSVGEWFGTTIPGIFSDEIEPPQWSPQLESAVALDWNRVAPALWDSSFPDAASVRLKWRETALALFKERWEKPVAQWCEQHNLIWCAEKPTYRPSHMDIIAQPSTDAGHRRVDLGPEKLPMDLRANGRVAMGVAEQNGGCEVRCECFHSLGWGATLQDQKWSIDWLGATGVNRFTPHAFYYSSSGLRKFDAAPSFFEENPYWAHFDLLGDYTARLGLALSRGREVAPVALLYPTKRLWRRDKADGELWGELMNAMLEAHIGFHVVDAPTIVRATGREGSLEIGRVRYETLVVPPYDESDEEMDAALEVAKQNGLHIVRVRSANDAVRQVEERRILSVGDGFGRERPEVWASWRQTPQIETDDAQNILFLANTCEDALYAHVRVRCDSTHWEEWSLENGEVVPIAAISQREGESEFKVKLPPFGSALLVGQGRAQSGALPAQTRRTLVLDTSGEWNVTRDEPNALRLNRWRIATESGNSVAELTSGEFDDRDWTEIESLPLFYRDKRVSRDVELLPHANREPIWYRRTIESEIRPDEIELLIESDAIGGDWSAYLNGEELPRASFAPRALHGHDKTACSLALLWREGRNTLALCVREGASHRERGGIRVPLHLIGNFGVATSSDGARVLTEPVRSASFFDLDGAGMPHFAGTARFSKRFPVATYTNYDELVFPREFEDIVQLRINGRDAGVRAWSPYAWTIPPLDVNKGEEIEVEVAITNTLLRFFEGRVWNAVTGERRNV
ncbi:hypothetical protein IAD21_05848 [Abditibacteriota bacterium]|nr:hypothetical protein IAD21_05848 [Abditibacteriota bacterium]